MEIPYTVYNNITGIITKTGVCEEKRVQFQKGINESVILGVYLPESWYVDVKTLEPVQKAMMQLSYELGSINGIPYGSTLYVKEMNKAIRADELASIKLEEDGEYTITVSHPQFRTGIVRLTAG